MEQIMYVVSAKGIWNADNKPGISYISYTRLKSGNIQIRDGSAMSCVCWSHGGQVKLWMEAA
ncbi:MAG: hypothetical protein ACLU80_04045 [Dorea sp.]